jgi:ubiquinone/menaquinone biosynthesis C-methylase UbiE
MEPQTGAEFKNYQRSYFDDLAIDRASRPIHTLPAFEQFFATTYVVFMDEWVRAYVDSARSGFVLDLGSGAGKYAQVAISASNNVHVVCADISLVTLQQAKARRDGMDRQSFLVCDAERLPFRCCALDGVMAVMILHHLPGFLALAEAHRVLKPKQEMLLAEMVTNNPARELMSRVYSWLPSHTRASLQAQEDITISDGRAPVTHSFTSQRLLATVKETGFHPHGVEFHSLFLFVFQYLAKVLPIIRRLVTQRMLRTGHQLERWLLQHSLPAKLACIVVCRCRKEKV